MKPGSLLAFDVVSRLTYRRPISAPVRYFGFNYCRIIAAELNVVSRLTYRRPISTPVRTYDISAYNYCRTIAAD